MIRCIESINSYFYDLQLCLIHAYYNYKHQLLDYHWQRLCKTVHIINNGINFFLHLPNAKKKELYKSRFQNYQCSYNFYMPGKYEKCIVGFKLKEITCNSYFAVFLWWCFQVSNNLETIHTHKQEHPVHFHIR